MEYRVFDPFKKECEFRYKENLYQALLKGIRKIRFKLS